MKLWRAGPRCHEFDMREHLRCVHRVRDQRRHRSCQSNRRWFHPYHNVLKRGNCLCRASNRSPAIGVGLTRPAPLSSQDHWHGSRDATPHQGVRRDMSYGTHLRR